MTFDAYYRTADGLIAVAIVAGCLQAALERALSDQLGALVSVRLQEVV